MSYVDLKHLLADLSLEAVRQPNDAAWAAVSAAYALLAEESRPAVSWESVRESASRLGALFSWRADESALTVLLKRGLLMRRGRHISAADDFAHYLEYWKRHAPRLLDVLTDLGTTGPAEADTDLRRGVALFNARLFFECHEYMEGMWKATSGPEKAFYHGIVQIAAAFYHFEKRNWHGASTLAQKGMRKLAGYQDSYLGVDVSSFRQAMQPWVSSFQNPEEGQEPKAYPRVKLLKQKRQGAPRG